VSLAFTGKVAVGMVRQQTTIDGFLQTNDFTGQRAVQTFTGAYLTQPTNIGTYHRNRFCVVPEANLSLNFCVCEWMRVTGGYSFLYATDVARPGDQIDRGINPTQAPAISGQPQTALQGAARPTFPARESDFWAQGLNLGLEFRY
jgi:hypothetical protein